MADDYDENILLDSNAEGAKSKKSKDFIPKPRILTSPAITLAAITGHSNPDMTDELPRRSKEGSVCSESTDSPKPSRNIDNMSTAATEPETKGVLSNGTTVSGRKDNGNIELRRLRSSDSVEWDDEMRTAGLEPSDVHLVEHPSSKPPVIKMEDGTYKRLISHSVSADEVVDDVEVVQAHGHCLCRICRHPTIRKNWKVYVGSIILTVFGLALVVWGLSIGLSQNNGFLKDLKSVIFLVGGLVLLLPGFYHLLFLSLAAYGVRGFKFSKLPSIRLHF